MKTKGRIILLFLFVILKVTTSVAQIDTVFYFAPPWVTPDHDVINPIKFHISSFSAASTTVYIKQPASPTSLDTFFVMGPAQLVDVTYWLGATASPTTWGYDSLVTYPPNVVRTNGVRIRSSQKITVVYDVVTVSPNNPETYSLKGQNAFGTEFVCPFQTKWNNKTLDAGRDRNGDGITTQPKSQINIVATQSNTVVWITPRCNIVGHLANTTFSVLLAVEGACYTAENVTQATNVPGQNLSGTIIVSDKPIAVTVSDDSVNPGSGSGQTCFDLMGDQIVPVELVGKDYIINRGQLNNQTGEAFFVVATENFTRVEIVGATTTTVLLNKGDTYTHNMDNNLTYAKSDKNVYLLSTSGYGCELGEALLPPLSCAGSDSVTFTRNNSDPFFLNVLCKAAAISNFTLANGTTTMALASSSFVAIPATSTLQGGPYYGAQFGPFPTSQIPANSSNLLFNSGGTSGFFAMGVINGTQNGGTLFHYMSSFLRRTEVKTQAVNPICSGSPGTVAVTGTITGADITGYWSTSYSNGSVTVNGGGSGSFPLIPAYSSSINVISTIYTVSVSDTTSALPTKTITLYLNSLGSCKSVTDSVQLVINQRPQVSVSSGTIMCKNNIVPVVLSGTVTNAVSGLWGGGIGGSFGAPGLVTTYTPSQADLAANTITITLTSQVPLPSCPNTVKTLTVGFINPPVVSIVPNNAVVCTNSSTLELNGSISGTTTGIWQGGTGAYTLTNTSPTATYILSPSDLSQSNITLTLSSIADGLCASESATMFVTVIAKPVVSVPPNFTVCAGSVSALLTGTVSGSSTQGIWTSNTAHGAFSNQQAQTSPVNTTYSLSSLDTNFIYFVLESAPGICPVEKDSIMVSILAAPEVKVNDAFIPVCRNAQIALTGTVSGYTSTGIWSTSSNTSSPGTFTPGANFLFGSYLPSEQDIENGFVILTLTSTDGQNLCPSSSAAFTASFIPSPTARFTFSPKRCVNSPLIFNDASLTNGTAFLKWSWDFGDNSPTGGSSSSNPIKTYTVAQQYVVTLTVTGVSLLNVECPDVFDTLIKIKPLPIADFSVAPACQDYLVKFTNQSIAPPGSDPIVAWKWEFGDSILFNVPPLYTGIPTSTVGHAYATPERFSAFLTVTATPVGLTPSLGCVSDPHREYVDVFSKPKAEFGLTNNPSVVQEPVYFSDFTTPAGNIASWFWEFGDEGSSADQAPVHTFQQAGIFSIKLTVTDFAGCMDTLRKDIDVTLLPQLPGGFTPNGDGVNDWLYVKGGPFANMIFRVYNNWGELVFETNDQAIGWDGKKNGVDQPVGVYIWTLVADMYNNRQVRKNGDITLLR